MLKLLVLSAQPVDEQLDFRQVHRLPQAHGPLELVHSRDQALKRLGDEGRVGRRARHARPQPQRRGAAASRLARHGPPRYLESLVGVVQGAGRRLGGTGKGDKKEQGSQMRVAAARVA